MLNTDKIIEQPTPPPYLKPYNDQIRQLILLVDEIEFRDQSSPSDLKKEVTWIVLNGTGKLLVSYIQHPRTMLFDNFLSM